MRFHKTIFILLWCLAIQNFVDAGSYRELLEAQFLNLTEDIKVGTAELNINAEDVDIVEVKFVFVLFTINVIAMLIMCVRTK